MEIIINGLEKAVGDYNRANSDGDLSPHYGRLMLDRDDGEVWTDEFYSLGHNERKVYHSGSIINLIDWASERYIEELYHEGVSVDTVEKWATEACIEWKKRNGEIINNEFSEKLKQARACAKITQAQMSDQMQIPQRTIEEWERGKRTPPEYVQRMVLNELEHLGGKDN